MCWAAWPPALQQMSCSIFFGDYCTQLHGGSIHITPLAFCTFSPVQKNADSWPFCGPKSKFASNIPDYLKNLTPPMGKSAVACTVIFLACVIFQTVIGSQSLLELKRMPFVIDMAKVRHAAILVDVKTMH